MLRARTLLTLAGSAGAALAAAQVPDMMTALDAGGRALGAGSAFNTTGVSTLSATYNPASLAYMTRSQVGIATRTLPTSETRVTGELNDLQLETKNKTGGYHGTHIGFAIPVSNSMDNHRVIGVAWTVGGWFHDTQAGQGLANGVATYTDFTRAQTDFFNLSFGSTSRDQSFAWGVGLVYAQQNVRNFQRITFTDTNIPIQESDTDTTGNGLGFQAGLMFTPRSNQNLSVAVTGRTPIKLKHSGSPLGLYDRVPGRLAAGAALRRDGFRNGQDYLILGAEIQHFFGGHDSPRLDRNEQTTAHFGAEYNWSHGAAIIPVRIGYTVVPAGGDGFNTRSALTYGIGYRPNHGDWVLEVNFGKAQHGGKDTGLYLTYRFGK